MFSLCYALIVKKRMGRPRLPKDLAKGRLLSVRFTGEEFKTLEKEAERQGVSLSELTRKTLLSVRDKPTLINGS
jgi:hypothetical protein